jgi:hypothetical protein
MKEITQKDKFMIRQVKNSCMTEYSRTMILSIHDNNITWRELKMFKVIILTPTLWKYLLEAYLQYALPSQQSPQPTSILHHRCK